MDRSQLLFLQSAMGLYFLAILLYLIRFGTRSERMGGIASVIAWLGVVAQTAMLVERGITARHVPLVSMYEYLVAFSWMVAICYLVFEARSPRPREGAQAAAAPTLLLALGLLAYASTLPVLMKQPEELMPLLRSNWLIFHVSTAVVAYGAAGLASALACLYSVRWMLKSGTLVAGTAAAVALVLLASLLHPYVRNLVTATGWAGSATIAVLALLALVALAGRRGRWRVPRSDRWLDERLPAETALDRSVYRAVRFAFPFLTLVNVTGAVWAFNAWGRYWGWDAKETWALITWLIYVFYLHARLRAGWRPQQTNAVVLVGIIAILFTFLGVSQLATFSDSLHSYASGG
jgi:cytochrome c-type biogenesis protein CcsB